MVASVRDLGAAIKHKMQQNTFGSSGEGSWILDKTMEHCLAEFTWSKIANVFQKAADIAHDRKEAAYADVPCVLPGSINRAARFATGIPYS